MNRFINIDLRPDPEFTSQLLLNALYSKLHKAFVQLKNERIGVSFPNHTNKHLGNCLRLHGSEDNLKELMSLTWINSMKEFVKVSAINSIPKETSHRPVRRIQAQSNPERVMRRMTRRLAARENLNEVQARQKLTEPPQKILNLPYVTLSSSSSGHNFRLYIAHQPTRPEPTSGKFNSYGLSTTATIPWF